MGRLHSRRIGRARKLARRVDPRGVGSRGLGPAVKGMGQAGGVLERGLAVRGGRQGMGPLLRGNSRAERAHLE